MKGFLKYFIIGTICFCVTILSFYLVNGYLEKKNLLVFSCPISLCGINLNGLTKLEAETKINNILQQNKQNISLKLTYKNKEWVFNNSDFIIKSNIHTVLDDMYKYNHALPL